MQSLSRRTTGELINRVSGDTGKLQDFIVDYGKDAIVYSCSTLILLAVMLLVNWKLTLLVLLPLPVVIFLILWLNRFLDWRYFRTWNKWDEASDVLHDILNGIRVVKTFGTEKRETQRYAQASLEMTTRLKKAGYLLVPDRALSGVPGDGGRVFGAVLWREPGVRGQHAAGRAGAVYGVCGLFLCTPSLGGKSSQAGH